MNPFKHLIKRAGGQPPIGTWLLSASPLLAEAAGHAGFDWAVIDMEHGPLDLGDVVHLLQAVAGTRMVPVLRVPWNDSVTIKRVLDAGATNLLVPMVQSAAEAVQAIHERFGGAGKVLSVRQVEADGLKKITGASESDLVRQASGDERAVSAAKAAISSPLLESAIDGARGVLLNITGPSSMGLFEMNAAAEIIHGVAHQDALIIFGTVVDDEMGDEVRVTVISAGFDRTDSVTPPLPDHQPRTSPTRITELFGEVEDADPLADDDDDFDVPSFLK